MISRPDNLDQRKRTMANRTSAALLAAIFSIAGATGAMAQTTEAPAPAAPAAQAPAADAPATPPAAEAPSRLAGAGNVASEPVEGLRRCTRSPASSVVHR